MWDDPLIRGARLIGPALVRPLGLLAGASACAQQAQPSEEAAKPAMSAEKASKPGLEPVLEPRAKDLL